MLTFVADINLVFYIMFRLSMPSILIFNVLVISLAASVGIFVYLVTELIDK